ncbi:hypothetical protein BTUL_0516g00020 [Botrytis tulipae]|uniref:Uncharacterized protein n=1 Tax=Botrytis tulipae TaxID=87230 RepID=A0A4Z1E7U8_9HELO|nr:hypothetical protein BTUL_0516g00020 [Botrytis tulipae]
MAKKRYIKIQRTVRTCSTASQSRRVAESQKRNIRSILMPDRSIGCREERRKGWNGMGKNTP